MSRSTLRSGILILGLITALVHLVVLNILLVNNPDFGQISIPFILNGLGFLAFLAIFFFEPAFLAGRQRLFHYAFIAFTVVTILAFLAVGGTGFGGRPFDPLGWATKIVELLLIIFLWMHMSAEEGAGASPV